MAVMAAKDALGRAGEDRAAQHLAAHGYEVVDRNWRAPGGELDIVALTAADVVVVEVKTRRSEGFGHPLEAVDGRKRERLWRLAHAWRAAHLDRAAGRRLRLDVIAITGPAPAEARLEHLRDVW
jgi:putative endonuclease